MLITYSEESSTRRWIRLHVMTPDDGLIRELIELCVMAMNERNNSVRQTSTASSTMPSRVRWCRDLSSPYSRDAP